VFSYQQLTGFWIGPDNSIWEQGYSGSGESKDNPVDENLVGKGPIPTGNYKIVGPPIDTANHGPCVLRLIPDELTRAAIIDLGRDPDSFLIHGDSIEHPGAASEGCIILSRATREKIWSVNATDADLTVVAI